MCCTRSSIPGGVHAYEFVSDEEDALATRCIFRVEPAGQRLTTVNTADFWHTGIVPPYSTGLR